jgi:hypothetical protein
MPTLGKHATPLKSHETNPGNGRTKPEKAGVVREDVTPIERMPLPGRPGGIPNWLLPGIASALAGPPVQ